MEPMPDGPRHRYRADLDAIIARRLCTCLLRHFSSTSFTPGATEVAKTFADELQVASCNRDQI